MDVELHGRQNLFDTGKDANVGGKPASPSFGDQMRPWQPAKQPAAQVHAGFSPVASLVEVDV